MDDLVDEIQTNEKSDDKPQGDIYEALDYGNDEMNENLRQLQAKLIEVLKQTNNYDGHMMAYSNLGIAYFRLRSYDKAEICHRKHLQITYPFVPKVPLQKSRPANRNEEKIALINLGCCLAAKGQYEKALQTLKNAIDIAEELGDMPSKARILNNMSNVYEQTLDFESAIECEKQRYDIAVDIADINGQIKSAAALGSFHQLNGEIREAISFYDKVVISLRMKVNDILTVLQNFIRTTCRYSKLIANDNAK